MENRHVKVETVMDLSHFEIGETITGSVFLDVDSSVDDELELLVVKRRAGKEDECLTNHSLNVVGDNISKNIRRIPFMIIPDGTWNRGNAEKIFIQTIAKKNNAYQLMDEVEIIYG